MNFSKDYAQAERLRNHKGESGFDRYFERVKAGGLIYRMQIAVDHERHLLVCDHRARAKGFVAQEDTLFDARHYQN